MSMAMKVENYCLQHSFRTKSILVDGATRACVNCIWYEQYYRQNLGNVAGWMPTCYGFCLRHEHQRGALRHLCRDYDTKTPRPEAGRAQS